MKVDVRLCGAIPRSEWEGAPCVTSRASYLAEANALASEPTGIGSKNEVQPSCSHTSQNQNNTINTMPLLEPPQWAVPAQGEARLEPVCEAVGSHPSIDLTKRSFFRIGRSPASDVQLLHGTSSRRHAMIFHHPNGSCYIVDCGSAHGTYVNGNRIITKNSGGWVVPQKVRRGSLIRFGGPGAPSFVLKSFSLGFSAMVSLDEGDEEEGSAKLVVPGGVNDMSNDSRRWVVQVNTRLNALGRMTNALTETSGNILPPPKRCSDDSLDKLHPSKRPRCMSPPLSPDQPPMRLVSPDSNHSNISSCIGLSPPLPSFSKSRYGRRVTFSDDFIQPFYPALVSSEELSCDEEDSPSF